MINATIKLNKRTFLIFGLIFVISFLFLLEFFINSNEKMQTQMNGFQDRIAYINSLGYEIDEKSEKESQVFIPEVFPQVLEDFNKKQQELGFDLHTFEGKTLERYTYSSKDNLIITLFVYENVLVGQEVRNN